MLLVDIQENLLKAEDDFFFESSPCRQCSARFHCALLFCPMCGFKNENFEPHFAQNNPDLVCQEIHGGLPEVDTPYCGSCGVEIQRI